MVQISDWRVLCGCFLSADTLMARQGSTGRAAGGGTRVKQAMHAHHGVMMKSAVKFPPSLFMLLDIMAENFAYRVYLENGDSLKVLAAPSESTETPWCTEGNELDVEHASSGAWTRQSHLAELGHAVSGRSAASSSDKRGK